MPADPADKQELLRTALDRARALLIDLRKQQFELVRHPDKLPPEQLEQGKAALEQAAQSAERTVRALELLVTSPPDGSVDGSRN